MEIFVIMLLIYIELVLEVDENLEINDFKVFFWCVEDII